MLDPLSIRINWLQLKWEISVGDVHIQWSTGPLAIIEMGEICGGIDPTRVIEINKTGVSLLFGHPGFSLSFQSRLLMTSS